MIAPLEPLHLIEPGKPEGRKTVIKENQRALARLDKMESRIALAEITFSIANGATPVGIGISDRRVSRD